MLVKAHRKKRIAEFLKTAVLIYASAPKEVADKLVEVVRKETFSTGDEREDSDVNRALEVFKRDAGKLYEVRVTAGGARLVVTDKVDERRVRQGD
jgi:hypothetical protein